MSDTIIKLENISKQYRLGQVGTQTLRGDFQRWWHSMRGKEDPTLKIGQTNQLNSKQETGNKRLETDYVWALRDINLEVKQGEILGIIGKNGAGKSTLLKLLSRVTSPTTGSIKVKGRIASLLEVGTGFHPELTGRENIFLNGAILGMTKTEIKSKFDEIVDFAGVAKYIDTPVKRYSSGMYVRLAFAVAAHLEPDILVVDEVLAVGDAEFQKKAIGKMQDISSGGGRTVLFVSHNMLSIKLLCPDSVLIENGRIISIGKSNDIISQYSKNVATFSFIKIWENSIPRLDNLYIKKIYLSDKNNNIISSLMVGESFMINIELLLKERMILGGFTLVFYDDYDQILFSALNNTVFYGKELSPGNYKTFCEIPSNLFNNGVFSINLIIFSYGYSKSITLEKVINFEVKDDLELRSDYLGDFKGAFRPKINWK